MTLPNGVISVVCVRRVFIFMILKRICVNLDCSVIRWIVLGHYPPRYGFLKISFASAYIFLALFVFILLVISTVLCSVVFAFAFRVIFALELTDLV